MSDIHLQGPGAAAEKAEEKPTCCAKLKGDTGELSSQEDKYFNIIMQRSMMRKISKL